MPRKPFRPLPNLPLDPDDESRLAVEATEEADGATGVPREADTDPPAEEPKPKSKIENPKSDCPFCQIPTAVHVRDPYRKCDRCGYTFTPVK